MIASKMATDGQKRLALPTGMAETGCQAEALMTKPRLIFVFALGMLVGASHVHAADFEIGGWENAPAANVRGRVVEIVCSFPPSGYLACRSRPLQTTVDVVLIEVDGSVSRQSVFTNRAGRFKLKVAPNRYYVFAPRPPVLGMLTEPVEITVPPEGVAITLRVEDNTR
jgi:hypothetical protein